MRGTKVTRTLTVLLALALSAASLAAPPNPGEHDAHDRHRAAVTAPPEGKLWPTDAPLRAGMSRIESALEQAGGQPVTQDKAQDLARVVRENVNYIVRNCKLPPEPDAALHVLIGRMMSAASQLESGAGTGAAVAQLESALQEYRSHFDHTQASEAK
jgi:hypothetical protein